jgi:hypothetical protein
LTYITFSFLDSGILGGLSKGLDCPVRKHIRPPAKASPPDPSPSHPPLTIPMHLKRQNECTPPNASQCTLVLVTLDDDLWGKSQCLRERLWPFSGPVWRPDWGPKNRANHRINLMITHEDHGALAMPHISSEGPMTPLGYQDVYETSLAPNSPLFDGFRVCRAPRRIEFVEPDP